ncbi:hypothetical protein L7F22_039313 [Adiantum nelumboides]|nr:hypothetical protein [Adiantum nelumboides]
MASTTKLIDSLRNGPASSLIQPASRAFMLGYLLDVLPTLFKQVLRYILVTLRTIARTRKRISQERTASRSSLGISSTGTQIDIPSSSKTTLYGDGIKPALQQLPLLLQSIVKALLTSLGPKGVAFTCALAMTSTMLMDSLISSILLRPTKNAFTNSSLRSGRRQAFSTFVSAAISSSFALYMIQKDAIGDHNALKAQYPFKIPFRKSQSNNRLLPTPLAPGGHFLARLTSLSVPATPGEKGSRSPVEKSFAKLPSLSPQDEKNPHSISRSASYARNDPSSEELGIASPTIDLSLFALVRAMDTFVRVLPLLFASRINLSGGTAVGPSAGMKLDTTRNQLGNAQRQLRTSLAVRLLQSLGKFGKDQAEGLTFVVACAIIMYNWFYHPERLPPTYVKWISNLASMDHRLLEALRCIRNSKPHYLQYGDRQTEPAAIDLLGSLAESMGHPYGWGDITRLPHNRDEAKKMKKEAIKNGDQSQFILHGAAGPRGRGELAGLPCELVHCGIGGPNCFKNALYRFLRAWKVCMGIYFPVHLVPRLIFGPGQFKREPIQALLKVLKGSMRSATFLSTYIASIWFMVCMARSMVLPRLFPNISFRYWDSGLGPIIGSWTCGWSVFIEEKRKRAEMALYVAPRALFALAEMSKPGWLSKGQKSALQAERLLFGMSVGIVIAAAKHRPEVLRGLTALIGWVVAPTPKAGSKRVRATAPRSS